MRTFDVDLHAHTRFFHGNPGNPTHFDPIGARLLGRFGRLRELDGLAFTNHDYFERYEPGTHQTAVIPGIEISTTEGHVLVVGPDPPRRTEPNALTPSQAVDLAHEHDCAAILPHPFRRGRLWETGADFDAVEVNGKRPHVQNRVTLLACDMGLPVVGGSDAHFPFEVGRVFTRIEAEDLQPESIVDAIRDGRVEPVVSETRLHRGLRRVYEIVHGYKGHVEEPPQRVEPDRSPDRVTKE